MPKPLSPIINWNHPLTKGLVFDMPLFERSNQSPLDIVNKVKGTYTGSSTPATGIVGAGIKFGGSNSNYIDFAEANWNINTGTQITLEALAIENDTAGGQLFSKPHASAAHTSPYFSYALQTTNLGARMWLTTSNNGGGVSTGEVAITAGKLYHFVGTYDGISMAVYLNGVQVASASATGTITNFSGVPLRITSNGGGSEVWNGTIFYSRMWNICLNKQTIKQLFGNPFQIYASPITQNFSSGIYH